MTAPPRGTARTPGRALGLAILALAALPEGGRGGRPAEAWEIELTVGVRAEYGLEAREFRTDGRLVFTAVWTGMMRRDDLDLLLMHRTVELPEWVAEERTAAGDRIALLSTGDFPERPDLKVDYAIRLRGAIHLSFHVHGFEVPVAAAPESFPLVLPASAEGASAAEGPGYNPFISEGSNAVVLDEEAMHRGPWEKEYRWSWKRRAWVQRQDQNVLEVQSHSVIVKVAATPVE